MADPETIFDLRQGGSSLLVSMPHSGTQVPPDIHGRMTKTAHRLPDTDLYVPELYAFLRDFDVTVVRARYNRYVIDLNRPPGDESLYPGRTVSGICPVEAFSGEALYKTGQIPDQDEIEDRIRTYWEPYHAALAEEIERIRGNHGFCILYDAHSIRSNVPSLFQGRLPDLNLGTNRGQSCSPALQRVAEQVLEQNREFSRVSNGRFIGGYITRHYGQPSAGVHALQMEIGQDAYLADSDPPVFREEKAAKLQEVLHALIRAVLNWQPDRP